VFGRAQSFVPGAPTNVQFMVEDSKNYAATGRRGFALFDKDGKPGNAAMLQTCTPCHAPPVIASDPRTSRFAEIIRDARRAASPP